MAIKGKPAFSLLLLTAPGFAAAAGVMLMHSQLWFATHGGKPYLFRMDLAKRTTTEIALPPLSADTVAYIAQRPTAPSTLAIATFERNVYVTTDGGAQWQEIAERGRTSG